MLMSFTFSWNHDGVSAAFIVVSYFIIFLISLICELGMPSIRIKSTESSVVYLYSWENSCSSSDGISYNSSQLNSAEFDAIMQLGLSYTQCVPSIHLAALAYWLYTIDNRMSACISLFLYSFYVCNAGKNWKNLFASSTLSDPSDPSNSSRILYAKSRIKLRYLHQYEWHGLIWDKALVLASFI